MFERVRERGGICQAVGVLFCYVVFWVRTLMQVRLVWAGEGFEDDSLSCWRYRATFSFGSKCG